MRLRFWKRPEPRCQFCGLSLSQYEAPACDIATRKVYLQIIPCQVGPWHLTSDTPIPYLAARVLSL